MRRSPTIQTSPCLWCGADVPPENLHCQACGQQQREEKLFRCRLCEREFDAMPPDGMHTIHGSMATKDGDYVDVDGECGPVYEVTDGEEPKR